MFCHVFSIFVFSFNLLFGLILYFHPSIFLTLGLPIFSVAFFGLIWSVHLLKEDFLGQLRLMFLAAIGYYAALTKLLGSDVVFSDFGMQIQSFEIGVKMFALTLLALVGSQFTYFYWPVKKSYARSLYKDLEIPNLKILHIISFVLILLISWWSSLSYGPPVWHAAYASGEGEGQLLGNLQSIGVILIGLNYLFAKKIENKFFWALSFFGYLVFLVWGILIRGGRLEFLSGLLVIFVAQKIIMGERRGFPLWGYIYLVSGAVFMEYLGHLRYVLADGEQEGAVEGVVRMLDNGVFFIGTISGIASTFANVIHMVENNVVDWLWGGGYAEYILRTLPEFIYPSRPKDLSFIFEQYEYVSIGGFFELAEAYLNFGLFGVMVIPALITYFFKHIQDKARAGSLLNYILLLSIVSVFMRGAWYQTFAYYKAMVTGLIIYAILRIVMFVFLSRSQKA